MVFVQVLDLKEIPALYSPSGKPETAITPLGFICSQCGKIMSLRPEESKQESRIIA